ncbi:hypothetical protein [Candidatus Uabimicrobium amorphum]|uniref:Uncharacterized protein n=1 Tax=Uabimicrobium amorphum TaxID=2596890 RepID=A0A5S9IMI1_UABAM|nr:hypothetical protein [Candidatus Uabimicrobium amorphum]BBM84599.1 hypothetical protein UABAM_02960 [Candidatus Uabimicrobium amorphum]
MSSIKTKTLYTFLLFISFFAVCCCSFLGAKYKSHYDVAHYIKSQEIRYLGVQISLRNIVIFSYEWEDKKRYSINYYHWHFIPWGKIIHESTPD